jgi:N-methylhydantoinase A
VSRLALSIDIGGTFTDIVIYGPESGARHIWKESTTPEDPARGVVTGVRKLLAREAIRAGDIGRVVHATTLFTNALIERRGARTGLLTTEGFRDVLEVQTERKYELYDIFIELPQPLVPRFLRREVAGRLSEAGAVEVPLDTEAVLREVDLLRGHGIESLAVAFLHAYVNPVHEETVRELLERHHPDLAVTTSAGVAPEIREYERISTAVANAYIKPLAERYLDGLAAQLRELGIGGPLFLMLSSGGLTHVEEAKRVPVRLLESGPAAGVLAAAHFGAASGIERQLAFDMGGTTAKASLVDDGEPLLTYTFEAGRAKRFMEGSGLPIKAPSIELIEIGAGGGSIARVDELGLLKVGPESAGAAPGPACYGRGGTAPTVTDADLLLGYLNPDFFLGGEMRIDPDAAAAAMRPLMDATGLGLAEVAFGIHEVVNENMAAAARVHVAKRGRDPRRYALVATGGAGPVHAYNVARKINVPRLVFPAAAGVGSAIGLLMAPARIDRVASMVSLLDGLDWEAFEQRFRELERQALEILAETGAQSADTVVRRLADMRYAGQASEVVVALPPGPYRPGSRGAIADAFEAAYRELFVRTPPNAAPQVINLRVSVQAPVAHERAPGGAGRGATPETALKGTRAVWFQEEGGFVATAVYDRYLLGAGTAMQGPAVLEERESTVIIGPGSSCEVDGSGSLVVTLPGKEA